MFLHPAANCGYSMNMFVWQHIFYFYMYSAGDQKWWSLVVIVYHIWHLQVNRHLLGRVFEVARLDIL
jgi:hypothetical protein